MWYRQKIKVLKIISAVLFEATALYKFLFTTALPDNFATRAKELLLLVTFSYQGEQLPEFTCLVTFE